MYSRAFSRNISENMHARCVREDTKQALKENLQADGVQSCQTLFVRYCLLLLPHGCGEKRGRNASAFCLVVKACVAVCYVLCVYTLNRNSTMSPSCMT